MEHSGAVSVGCDHAAWRVANDFRAMKRRGHMAAQTLSLMARSQQDLETMTMSYIAQGYMVANKTPW